MARPARPKLIPYDCSNPECSNVVQPRRHSQTGDHWCQEPACQSMKQKQLRAARKIAMIGNSTVEDERLTLLRSALHKPRAKCPECDLEDGVPGFLHRAAPQSKQICDGLGGAGRAAGALWIDTVHPERAEWGS